MSKRKCQKVGFEKQKITKKNSLSYYLRSLLRDLVLILKVQWNVQDHHDLVKEEHADQQVNLDQFLIDGQPLCVCV